MKPEWMYQTARCCPQRRGATKTPLLRVRFVFPLLIPGWFVFGPLDGLCVYSQEEAASAPAQVKTNAASDADAVAKADFGSTVDAGVTADAGAVDAQRDENRAAGVDQAGVDQAAGKPAAEHRPMMRLVFPGQNAGMMDPQVALLKRYATVQLALLRRTCKLTEEQVAGLADLDDNWIRLQIGRAQQAREENAGPAGGMEKLLGDPIPAARLAPPQPHELLPILRNRIDEQINQHLTESQRNSFDRERDAREQFQRDALAESLVAVLDRHLYLKLDQRQALTADVSEWLKEEKAPFWQFYFQNKNYIPNIPMPILQMHLDVQQLSSLNGLHRWNNDNDQMEWQMAQHQGGEFVISD